MNHCIRTADSEFYNAIQERLIDEKLATDQILKKKTLLSGRICANLRRTWNLILNFFSLLSLVVHTLSFKNPSDATLASLSISIHPRWRPRLRTLISEKNV